MVTLARNDSSIAFQANGVTLIHSDCIQWLRTARKNSIQAVVTDPPYGMVEYMPDQLAKMRAGRGGVWRIPPAMGGHVRRPVPRFTVLSQHDLDALSAFLGVWASALLPVLVPGAHVLVATSPLLNHIVSAAMLDNGFEKRGEIVRLVRTLRGGDRPKGAEAEFPSVSAMPRSCWEPWILVRKPLEGRLADNLRKWHVGGLRRPADANPFVDVIESGRTSQRERAIAQHPSLKPQAFLRNVVRGMLPLGRGVVLDPFAGSGSTLAACVAVGYKAIGVESDASYIQVASKAILELADLEV